MAVRPGAAAATVGLDEATRSACTRALSGWKRNVIGGLGEPPGASLKEHTAGLTAD